MYLPFYTLCELRRVYLGVHAGPKRRPFSLLRQGDSSTLRGRYHDRAQVETGGNLPASGSAVNALGGPGLFRSSMAWLDPTQRLPDLPGELGDHHVGRAGLAASRGSASRMAAPSGHHEGQGRGTGTRRVRGPALSRRTGRDLHPGRLTCDVDRHSTEKYLVPAEAA